MSYIKNVSKEQETGYISSVGSWTRAKSDDIGVFSSSSNFTVQKCYAGNEYKDRNEVYAEQIDATQTNEEALNFFSSTTGIGKRLARSPTPWGGEGGKPWNDGVFNGIKKIYLVNGESAIHCIQIQYDKHGQSLWSARHGGGTPGTSKLIKLDYPDEYLTHISGCYGSLKENEQKIVVKSLTFYSNIQQKYGPFGEEKGTTFMMTSPKGKIVGLYGRNNSYLTAIGVHMQPTDHTCEKFGSIKTLIHKYISSR